MFSGKASVRNTGNIHEGRALETDMEPHPGTLRGTVQTTEKTNMDFCGGKMSYYSGYDIASLALVLAFIWAWSWLIFVLGLSFGRVFY
jgi:hypothetical protein